MSCKEDDPDGSSLTEGARGGDARVENVDKRREVDATVCCWGVC